jgi:hypothetical protein
MRLHYCFLAVSILSVDVCHGVLLAAAATQLSCHMVDICSSNRLLFFVAAIPLHVDTGTHM